MGDPPGPADVPDGSNHGGPRPMYSYGSHLESSRTWRRRLLRYIGRHQLHPADCPLLALCAIVCERHWHGRRGPCHVPRCGHFRGNCTRNLLLALHILTTILQYLGIPLAAGVITRYTVWYLTSKTFLTTRFLPLFSPLALLGLLYTIIVMFAYQGHHIVRNLGPVFRVFVPMILYFIIMWFGSFGLVLYFSRRESREENRMWGYEMAVVQSFTAGSNNFVSAVVPLREPLSPISGPGTRDCGHNRSIWGWFRPGTRRNYRAPGRSPSALSTHLAVTVPGQKAALDKGRQAGHSRCPGARGCLGVFRRVATAVIIIVRSN